MPVLWSIGDNGMEWTASSVQKKEATVDVDTSTQVRVTVFGNRFRESCNSGG
jgi:hypothetical protein